ncbi:hypothetical protein DVH24_003637, partial [Malus domestica]
HRSTILSVLGLPFLHGFVFGNSRATSQWVTHPGSALASFSLNFGVPTEPQASELPKGLVLGSLPWAMWDVTTDPTISVSDLCTKYADLKLNAFFATKGLSCKVLHNDCHIPARAPTTSRLDSTVAPYCSL